MTEDHLNGAGTESTDKFTTGNYSITTCSQTEWRFTTDDAATPEQLNLDRWPEESEETLKDRSHWRKRRPMHEIEKEAETRNEQLTRANQPKLIREEIIAANLYTGPVRGERLSNPSPFSLLTSCPVLLPHMPGPPAGLHGRVARRSRLLRDAHTSDVRQIQRCSTRPTLRLGVLEECNGEALLPEVDRRQVHGLRQDC
eukprot:2326441-Prymnesium_polylepis.1